MSVILIGCQSNVQNGLLDENIVKVSVSKSNGFGKVNSDFFTVYEDEDALNLFEKVISNAVKVEGIADMAEPEFDLEVVYSGGNKYEYHLWLGKKGQKSTLMNINNTHTIYSISEEITNQLVNALK